MGIQGLSRRATIAFASLAGGLFMAGGGAAATPDGKFAVEGPGQAACARILQAKDANAEEYARYIGFIEGYMSAANRYEPNTFDLTPWHNSQALSLILTTHCESHPKDILGVVVQQLVGAMMPLRLASYSAMEQIADGENRAEVYAQILKRSQEALARRGLYRGPADGRFSPEMRNALLEFQKAAQLDPTGVPDTATLWTLLNP